MLLSYLFRIQNWYSNQKKDFYPHLSVQNMTRKSNFCLLWPKWWFFHLFQDILVGGGGRKRLPKFKFSAKFPIGLHVILQIQLKKFENDCYIMWKIILTENPSRFNVEPLLK